MTAERAAPCPIPPAARAIPADGAPFSAESICSPGSMGTEVQLARAPLVLISALVPCAAWPEWSTGGRLAPVSTMAPSASCTISGGWRRVEGDWPRRTMRPCGAAPSLAVSAVMRNTNFSRSIGGSSVTPSATVPSRATESIVAVVIQATYRVNAPNDLGGGRWLRYATGWYCSRPSGRAATVNGFGR